MLPRKLAIKMIIDRLEFIGWRNMDGSMYMMIIIWLADVYDGAFLSFSSYIAIVGSTPDIGCFLKAKSFGDPNFIVHTEIINT